MHAIFLLFLLLPVPGPSLHKCLGADGVASYQSLPCAPGQRTAWTRAAPSLAEPAPPAASPRAAPPPARPGVAMRRTDVVRKSPDPSAARCAAARRAAAITRDRLWNRLSFRQRSDLDSQVARACARR